MLTARSNASTTFLSTVAWVLFSSTLGPDHAHAGPPLLSDDPHTIGPGRVEAIVALQTGGQQGADLVNTPQLDLTIGVANGLDLTLVASPSFVIESAQGTSTTGSVVGGFKWRPIAGPRFVASITPAIGVEVLSAEQFFVTLPLQAEYAFSRAALGVDVGYQIVRHQSDSWNASVYGTFVATPDVQLMAEVWALTSPVTNGTDIGGGLGVDWHLGGGVSALAMVGTGIASTGAKRVEWVGYLGFRWAFALTEASVQSTARITPSKRSRLEGPRPCASQWRQCR